MRVQNQAYNEHKASLTTNDLLVHVDFAESYRNDQQDEIQSAYFGNQSFSLFTSFCYYLTDTDNLGQKSVVVVTEKSDHNRITSMSCLKKVIETIETQCGKIFNNIVVWSDGMGAQFRSKFIFQHLAGNLFPDKSLSWYYNERHHGKGPMDGVGGTIKNVIFRKMKSGHDVVYTPNQFADAALKFVPSITTVYLPCTEEITEPGNIDQSPAIAATLSIHKF